VSKRTIISIAIVIVGIAALALWRIGSSVVFSDETLIKLNSGITTNELVKIVGEPSSVYQDQWYYDRFLYSIGVVTIDEKGRVVRAVND
jgi:hypothetical protein